MASSLVSGAVSFLLGTISYTMQGIIEGMYAGLLLAGVLPTSIPRNFSLSDKKEVKFYIFLTAFGVMSIIYLIESVLGLV